MNNNDERDHVEEEANCAAMIRENEEEIMAAFDRYDEAYQNALDWDEDLRGE